MLRRDFEQQLSFHTIGDLKDRGRKLRFRFLNPSTRQHTPASFILAARAQQTPAKKHPPDGLQSSAPKILRISQKSIMLRFLIQGIPWLTQFRRFVDLSVLVGIHGGGLAWASWANNFEHRLLWCFESSRDFLQLPGKCV